jgi:fructan beta-fructosidase
MRNILLLLSLITMISSCSKSTGNGDSLLNIVTDTSSTLVALKESDYRPSYHFTPPAHWMNDPNGLIYYNGKYHLFFQYNPNNNVWGPMNWGHATSSDFFNWQDQPIALSPDNSGTIFSGSVVDDATNTSGFKNGPQDPLVAIYTIAGSQQSQGIAYSNDGGMNWTKYAGNPVLLNPGINDFRDPKVSWYAPANKWVMTLATGNKVSFYSSADLKSWVFESSFGEAVGAHGGVWECPDLFELPVDGTNTSKWVLMVSINPGGPNGGSATQYFVGDFDGKSFTPSNSNTQWIDYGTDDYAGVTYSNIASYDGRRIMISWMSNWIYAQQVPTTTWRSTMTVPKTLSLISTGQNNYLLKSAPVNEINNYKVNTIDTSISSPSKSIQLSNNKVIQSGSYDLNFSADLNTANTLSLALGNSIEKLIIAYDKSSGLISIDRSSSGNVDFNTQFRQKMVCPYIPKTGQLTDFRMLVDKTSMELFVNGGEKVMTALFFPTYQYNYLKLQTDVAGNMISNFKIKAINKSMSR